MKPLAYSFLLAVICVICGCSKNEGKDATFNTLPDDAVIVKVNNHVLKKKDLLQFMEMEYRNAIQDKGMDKSQLNRRLDEDFKKFVPTYISQNLLVDDAKKHKVLSADDVARRVDAMIDAAAKAKKMTRKEFLERNKQDEWYVRASAEKRIWINAHTASNIPPDFVVTPQLVTNFLNLIETERAASQITNEAIRVRLEGIRADCLAGNLVFTNVAAQISSEDWDLGELERTQFDSAALRNAVFTLKEGMISPVLDIDESFAIVYLKKILPAERNKDGTILQHERRHAYQIVLEKADFPIPLTYDQAFKDLAYQAQLRALTKYVEFLKTNGVNTIEWPNGSNLFKRVSSRR